MIFHKHTNASGVVVFEIPENVWFATNLRLYLTGHGAHTDITEVGSEVHVQIDTDIEIMCCIANADEPTTVKTTTYENYKDSKSKSTPNEKTATNYDEHNVEAEQDNPTDGKYCATCGVIKEDHDATHSFKPNYNK